jgi:hypothetical protein
MHRFSHILVAWVLLVQAVALVKDNPQLLRDGYEYWMEAATFDSQDRCTAEADQRQTEDKKVFKVYGENGGVILSFRYRCLEKD